ncbi:hypothetical protein BC828DRAFT_404362 [Blastocladiella britannica]|nr:hypothetical protein BC828DRAFT_404362 [Blastocladiella britannica]
MQPNLRLLCGRDVPAWQMCPDQVLHPFPVTTCNYFNVTTYCDSGLCVPRTTPLGDACSSDQFSISGNNPCAPPLICDGKYDKCNDPTNPVDFSAKPVYQRAWFIALCIAVPVLAVVAVMVRCLRRSWGGRVKAHVDVELPTYAADRAAHPPPPPRYISTDDANGNPPRPSAAAPVPSAPAAP